MFQRLDRVLCNEWRDNLMSSTMVYHVHRIISDHRPLVIRFDNLQPVRTPKPFRFLSCWLDHKDFSRLVNDSWKRGDCLGSKIRSFVENCKEWN